MSKLSKKNIQHAVATLRLEGMNVNPKVVELYEDYYDGKISYDFFKAETERLIQEEMDAAEDK